MAHVIAINVSKEKGQPKDSILACELIENYGIAGDAHAGNWHRQLSLLANESADKIRAQGIEGIIPGRFAENITTSGIILHTLAVGTCLRVGEALLEITQIGKECHQHCAIYHLAGDCVMPREGIFARVLQSGTVKTGDEIKIVELA